MKQLIEDLISAMEYHVEQTRPIYSTTVALQAARDALRVLAAHVQEPVCHICNGTGEMDSGGTHPWGWAINIPCECTAPPAQPAPASWMETVTANLVREGINKHKARELAEHFYSLAQPAPVQEPVAWATMLGSYAHVSWGKDRPDYPIRYEVPLYTTPPAAQRQWVGLTQEDIDIAFDDTQEGGGFNEFAYAIEAKLKEKNEL